jgi:hypothetical protein
MPKAVGKAANDCRERALGKHVFVNCKIDVTRPSVPVSSIEADGAQQASVSIKAV